MRLDQYPKSKIDLEKMKLATSITSIILIFFATLKVSVESCLNFSHSEYFTNIGELKERCEEICKKTQNSIDTVVQYSESNLKYYKSTEILSNFGPMDINAGDDRPKVFLHGCKRDAVLESTRHEAAFVQAGVYMGQKSIEDNQRNLHISYPGMGAHISILGMFKSMVDTNPDIESIYLYSPELIEGYYLVDSFLIYLNDINYIHNYQIQRFQIDEVIDVFMSFQIQGVDIAIQYHVDPNREAFIEPGEFEPSGFLQTDLLVLHDLGRGTTVEATRQAIQEVQSGSPIPLVLAPKQATHAKEGALNFELNNEVEILHPIAAPFGCNHTCSKRFDGLTDSSPWSAAIIEIKTP